MAVNPDFLAPCGLYCGVCAIYIADRDNNQKFKERLVDLYKGRVSGKGTLPSSENLTVKKYDAVAACLMTLLSIARSVRLGLAHKKKVTEGVTHATTSPASTLTISR